MATDIERESEYDKMGNSVNPPLRVIQVGAGGMGRAWLRTLLRFDGVELVGLVDIDPAGARTALTDTEAPDVPVAETLDAVAGKVSADFVLDVTIPEAHHAVTLQAFQLGLPVLGEKPLAATLTEALELAAASEAYDQLFVVSQNRRYNPHLFAFRDQLANLGELGVLAADFFKAPHFGGFRDAMDHPLLLDMAIHQFDMARFLSAQEPVSVYCEEFNPAWSWYAGDAAATAIFELSQGARFVFDGSWCSDGHQTSWNASWRASLTNGTALWNGDDPPVVDLAADASIETPTGSQPDGNGIGGTLRDFAAALRTGRRPMGECHDNVASLAMVHAAIASSRTGQRVGIADILEKAHAGAVARSSGPVRDALTSWTGLTPPGR